MKYIKKFEYNKLFLEPYQMYTYKPTNTPVCYIGNNGSKNPNLFLFFGRYYDDYEFNDYTEYTDYDFIPMDISVEDYIFEKNIVDKIMNSIRKRDFITGPSGLDSKLIIYFKMHLLSDKRIEEIVYMNKYNL